MEEKIADFLLQAHPARKEERAAVIACPNLYRDAWLDSLLQLRLLAFLEQEFKIYIPAFQVSLATFQNVGAIAALVRKLQNAGPVT